MASLTESQLHSSNNRSFNQKVVINLESSDNFPETFAILKFVSKFPEISEI